MSALTIVVPTYNRRDELVLCLESILRHAPGCPVLVVDDGGTDGTHMMVRERFPKTVRCLRYERNRGPAHARNRALESIETPYAAFVDSDVEFSGSWLDAVLAALQPDTVLAGRVERPDGSLEWGPRKTMFWGGSRPCISSAANVASSNNMVVPVALSRAVGGFAEDLGFYFEDTYFCIRARKIGFKVRYLDDARIIHHHNSTRKPERIERLVRNRTYAMVKDADAPVCMSVVQAGLALAEAAQSVAAGNHQSAGAALRGFIRGVRDAGRTRFSKPSRN
ncbi:MAG: glycosyltransferase family 2 protein [Acidobacteriota bacterium]